MTDGRAQPEADSGSHQSAVEREEGAGLCGLRRLRGGGGPRPGTFGPRGVRFFLLLSCFVFPTQIHILTSNLFMIFTHGSGVQI
jgi:hypothetical protein